MRTEIQSGKDYRITRRFYKNAIKIRVRQITDCQDFGPTAWAYRIAPTGCSYGREEIPYPIAEILSAEEIS